jgi:hypothetical protein
MATINDATIMTFQMSGFFVDGIMLLNTWKYLGVFITKMNLKIKNKQ